MTDEPEVPMNSDDEKPCQRCDGCGKIADSTDGEPWSVWESLPAGSDIAVRIGIVKPILCPACGGSGVTTPAAL